MLKSNALNMACDSLAQSSMSPSQNVINKYQQHRYPSHHGGNKKLLLQKHHPGSVKWYSVPSVLDVLHKDRIAHALLFVSLYPKIKTAHNPNLLRVDFLFPGTCVLRRLNSFCQFRRLFLTHWFSTALFVCLDEGSIT